MTQTIDDTIPLHFLMFGGQSGGQANKLHFLEVAKANAANVRGCAHYVKAELLLEFRHVLAQRKCHSTT